MDINFEGLDRCAENFVYFCENFCKIMTPKSLIVPFKLYEYQKDFVKALESKKYILATKVRQGGFTNTTLTWLLWKSMFTTDQCTVVINKTDRECLVASEFVKRIIDNLPEGLKPVVECRGHEIIFNDPSNSRIVFSTSEMRGTSINRLIVEEAAFIPNMDKVWAAMFPCLKADGQVLILSTPYENKGWFYETYTNALKGLNDFRIWKADHTEHPDHTPAWEKEIRKNLGARWYMREILQQFVTEEVFKFVDNFDEEKEFLQKHAPKTLDQGEKYGEKPDFEFNCQPLLRSARHKYGDEIQLDWNFEPTSIIINENPDCDDPLFAKKALPRTQPTVVKFEEHTREEIEEIFKKEHETWRPASDNHPAPCEDLPMNSTEEMAEFWAGYAEAYPDDGAEQLAKYWGDAARAERQWLSKMEQNIDTYARRKDLLVMAGVIGKDEEISEIDSVKGKLAIIHKLEEDFRDMELTFFENKLCINGVQTCIEEDAIESAYVGLSLLQSHNHAVEYVSGIVKRKLKKLF